MRDRHTHARTKPLLIWDIHIAWWNLINHSTTYRENFKGDIGWGGWGSSVFIFRVCRTICLLCSDSLYRYVWMKHGLWRWVDLCSSGLSACCCTTAQSYIGAPYVLLTYIHWHTYILLSDRETDLYVHIMSNSSRISSLSFIEIFQNRKQFQGINSIQNPRHVMITYYFLFYIQYSAWVLI